MSNVITGLAGATILLAAAGAAPAQAVNAVQMAYLGPDRGTYYGRSADIDGDTAIVGALGSAHIFHYEQGRWLEQAALAEGQTLLFGRPVGIEGDTAVVGQEDGPLYVFTRAGSRWTLQASFDLPSMSGADETKYRSIAMDDDTFIVGVVHEMANTEATFEIGRVYVFTSSGSAWSLQSQVDVAQARYAEVTADLDGDTFVAKTWTGTPETEEVQVYTRAGDTWTPQTMLTVDEAQGHEFTHGVAIDGNTIMAGASNGVRGTVYVFEEVGGMWQRQTIITPQGFVRFPHTGVFSIAIEGNVAVFGAPGHSLNGRSAGSGYLFVREEGTWRQQDNLVPDYANYLDSVGHDVATDGSRLILAANGRVTKGSFVYELSTGQKPRLLCPGDVNGDGETDFAVVNPDGVVVVKGLSGTFVNAFGLYGEPELADAELLHDFNGNGSPELVAWDRHSGVAQVRDLLTSGVLGSVPFDPELSALDVEPLPDRTGNGVPELAALVEFPYTVFIRDAMTGQSITQINLDLPRYKIATDLDVHAGSRGGDPVDLLVTSEHWEGGVGRIDFRDSATGSLVRRNWIGGGAVQHVQVADMNGNGSPETATRSAFRVQIRDSRTNEKLNVVSFDSQYVPIRLVAIPPDKDGNNASELVMMAKRRDGTVQRAEIRDSRTGRDLGRLWFDRNFPVRDFAACGDINGNGAADVAMLGQRARDRHNKLVVRDTKTHEHLGTLWFR